MMRFYFFFLRKRELMNDKGRLKCINRPVVVKVCTHRCSRGFPLKGIPAFQPAQEGWIGVNLAFKDI